MHSQHKRRREDWHRRNELRRSFWKVVVILNANAIVEQQTCWTRNTHLLHCVWQGYSQLQDRSARLEAQASWKRSTSVHIFQHIHGEWRCRNRRFPRRWQTTYVSAIATKVQGGTQKVRDRCAQGVHKVLISWWLHVRTCPIRGRTCRSCPGLCDMRHLLTSTRTFARSHILLCRHPRGSARVDAAAEYSCQLVTRSLGPRTVSACSCCPAYNPTHNPLLPIGLAILDVQHHTYPVQSVPETATY